MPDVFTAHTYQQTCSDFKIQFQEFPLFFHWQVSHEAWCI